MTEYKSIFGIEHVTVREVSGLVALLSYLIQSWRGLSHDCTIGSINRLLLMRNNRRAELILRNSPDNTFGDAFRRPSQSPSLFLEAIMRM